MVDSGDVRVPDGSRAFLRSSGPGEFGFKIRNVADLGVWLQLVRGSKGALPRGSGCFFVAGHGLRVAERGFCKEVAGNEGDGLLREGQRLLRLMIREQDVSH